MRKIIYHVLLCIALHLHAQQVNTNVMQYWGTGAMWITEAYFWVSPPTVSSYSYFLQYMKDTIINNTTYHELVDFFSIPNTCFWTSYSLTETIALKDTFNYVITQKGDTIFDFNPNQKGDSTCFIPDCYFGNVQPNKKYKIDSVWYENNGNKNLKFLLVEVAGAPYNLYAIWISGIGSADGGFAPFGYHNMWSVYSYCSKCFSYNDTIYYLNIPPYTRIFPYPICGYNNSTLGTLVKIRGRCDTLSAFKGKIAGVDILKSENDFVKVYPQPLIDELYIELPFQNNTSIRLYDIKGSVIKEFQSIGEKMILPANDIPSGFYFIEIKLNNELIIRRKIIKL
ncbi:MAG: T9SS type A sorting domain-containing protein [Bacteroidota bacterium]